MKRTIQSMLLLLILVTGLSAQSPYVLVLGIAQDAGIPQAGCDSPFCRRAWKDAKLRQKVSSIALVDPKTGGRWVFDATPDFPEQFQLLKEVSRDTSNRLDGIFLTHAHIGHYTGLMYLGRESMNAKAVTVYAMPRMKSVLEAGAPWSQLVSLRNIVVSPMSDDQTVQLAGALSVRPFIVPHRDEYSETVGFRISSGNRSLVFIPDIDKWQKWRSSLAEVVKGSDYVLLDGTFFRDGEIDRPMSEVPHPFVTETMELLQDLSSKERSKVHFIHFNHSNLLVQGDAGAVRSVTGKGFGIAREGQKFGL